MRRMKNADLIKSFVLGATEGQSTTGNLRIVGDNLVNYSTVIAKRQISTFLVNNTKYSVTTSKIQSQLRYQLGRENKLYKEVEGKELN